MELSENYQFDSDWHDLLMEGKVPGIVGKRVKLMRRSRPNHPVAGLNARTSLCIAAQKRPMTSPLSSMSTFISAGVLPRPGMVRISPSRG